MFADLARRERDAEAAVGELLEHARLLEAGRRANHGLQAAQVALDHLEAEVRLILEHELIALAGARLAAYLRDERRADYVTLGELHRDGVVARRRRIVDHVARAVLVVAAVDLGLARSLDRNGQAAHARVLGHDAELARLVREAVRQTRAVCCHVAAAASSCVCCCC